MVKINFKKVLGDPQAKTLKRLKKRVKEINELAPKYGIKLLVVMGSGLIGDTDPAWNFRHINDPLGENGSNYYIDMYLERLRETAERDTPARAATICALTNDRALPLSIWRSARLARVCKAPSS